MYDFQKSFKESSTYCDSMGMRMVSFENDTEQVIVMDAMVARGKFCVQIKN
jgi:hypothetical protein